MRQAWFIRGLALIACAAPFAFALETLPGGPPPPPGYESNELLMKDLTGGKLPIIRPYPAMPEGITEQKDIEYGKVGERALLLDIYRPAKLDKPVPGLIFIHGGGWKSGNKKDYQYHCVEMAKRGYVAASMGYRLSGEAPFPAAVQDAQCAVRWMREHAAEYGIDPNRIAVMGGSAGGHLSLMVGYAEDDSFPKTGGHDETNAEVQAVVNLYGVADCTTEMARTANEVTSFLGKTYSEAPEVFDQCSPMFHLDAQDPPTLTFHGTIDDIVPVAQADALAARLDELEIPHVYCRLDGWPHTMDLAKSVNDYVLWYIDAFLKKHLPEPK